MNNGSCEEQKILVSVVFDTGQYIPCLVVLVNIYLPGWIWELHPLRDQYSLGRFSSITPYCSVLSCLGLFLISYAICFELKSVYLARSTLDFTQKHDSGGCEKLSSSGD